MKKKNKIILAILLGILIIPTGTWAIGGIFSGFRTSSTNQVIDAHGVCKQIKNTGSKNYFVPTNTSSEWSSFLINTPIDISVNECGLTCGIFDNTSFSKMCDGTEISGSVGNLEGLQDPFASCKSMCENLGGVTCCRYLEIGQGQAKTCFSYGGSIVATPGGPGQRAVLCN